MSYEEALSAAADSLTRLQTAVGPRYVVLEVIGTGGMGAVYLARDTRHGRQVAIKIMKEEVAESVGAMRFLREIEIASRLQHPHILPLFDSGESGGLLFYIMPFIDGESLRARIDREKQLALSEVCRITRQIASALTYAHSLGIVHRDIKPHNILLSHGEAMVADFGIAKAVAAPGIESSTISAGAVGTPMYMSPEQAMGDRALDGRSDQYALACVVYEMLAGKPPFAGATPQAIVARHLCDPPPSLTVVRQGLPREAERVIETALSKSPSDRHASAAAFAAALESAIIEPTTGAAGRSAPTIRANARQWVNTGRLVSKTCNRWMQVNAFDSFLRTGWKTHPGRPQVFVIHGEEGQGHESLLERLLATTIARFAEELDGPERGSVVRLRAPWPEADDPAVAQRDLAIALFREADPRYMDDELSSAALRSIVIRRLGRVAVIHHDIRAKSWGRETASLFNWYVNHFLGSLESRRSDPQLLVFLKIIYPPTRLGGLLSGLFRAEASRRKRIQETLTRLSSEPSRCGFMVFKELQSVTVDDVKDWFNDNYIHDSELQREASVKAIFQGAVRKRMVEIEPALAEIHEAAVAAGQWQGVSQ